MTTETDLTTDEIGQLVTRLREAHWFSDDDANTYRARLRKNDSSICHYFMLNGDGLFYKPFDYWSYTSRTMVVNKFSVKIRVGDDDHKLLYESAEKYTHVTLTREMFDRLFVEKQGRRVVSLSGS